MLGLALASLAMLGVACAGDGGRAPQPSVTEAPIEVSEDGGPAEYSTDELTITAAELLRRSDEAMRVLDFVRVFTTDPGAEYGFSIDELADRPGMLRRVSLASIEPVGGVATWREELPASTARPAPGVFDRFDGELGRDDDGQTPAQGIRLVGETAIDGREVWVLWYWYKQRPGITTWFTEWIEKETLWLLRQETNIKDGQNSHDGQLRMLFDFNDRAASLTYPIEPPPATLRRFTETLVTAVTDDSYVQESWPDGNFGAGEQLRAEGAPWLRTLVGFDVTELPAGATILSVRLGLHVMTAPTQDFVHEGGSSVRIGAAHIADGEWEEGSVTWENAPSLGAWLAEIGSTLGFPAPERVEFTDVWVEADVTATVTGNGRYSFYIINQTDLVGPRFSSSESGANGPILVITYEFTEPPTVPSDSVTR